MKAIPQYERELEVIYEPEKIQHLLKKYLGNQRMFLRGFDPPYAVKIAGFSETNVLSVDMGEYEAARDEELVLFRILGRYMHLSCTVIAYTGQANLFTLMVNSAAIARKDREALRIPIHGAEAHISNIRTSKYTIDATLFNIPTSVKVGFSTFEQQLRAQNLADVVKIDVYGKRGTVLDEIRKTGKTLLVSDTGNPAAYRPANAELLDYAAFLDDKLQDAIAQYRRQKIKSELIAPVVYLTHDMSAIPLGYIQLQSRSHALGVERVGEIEGLAQQMVERIRDSNTVVIQERQEVLNLSRGGLRVNISHPELKDYLARQQGFTFDLFFRMQAPVTLHALIRATHSLPNGNMILGLQISGRSSRQDQLKRFEININHLEDRVRAELAKRKALQQ